MIHTLLDQSLLKNRLKTTELRVFFCGPGVGHALYDFRGKIRNLLESMKNVEVFFGEDLESAPIAASIRTKPVDLQSLEETCAHLVDFTILLLESPGSIAELGTFSMLDSLRPRLFVLVPDRYHGGTSYIARGPLSILASYRPEHVIYFGKMDADNILQHLAIPLMFFRYARGIDPSNYDLMARHATRRTGYKEFITQSRARFDPQLALAAINILSKPKFVDLVQYLRFHPGSVSRALKELFEQKCIIKAPSGVYKATKGFSDPLLTAFDAREISQKR